MSKWRHARKDQTTSLLTKEDVILKGCDNHYCWYKTVVYREGS